MTEFLAWCVFAAIPVLLVVGEIRAARKRKRSGQKSRTNVENRAILLMYGGAAVIWAQRLGGAAMARYAKTPHAGAGRPRRRRIPLAVLAGCAVALLGAAWRAATGGAP